jgi:hypothetical protein
MRAWRGANEFDAPWADPESTYTAPVPPEPGVNDDSAEADWGLWTFKSSIAVQPVGQRPFRSDRIGGDAGGVSGAEPASGFPRGSSIEIGQQTLVELKCRISIASWRRPKMNTWGYPIVEEVDHENAS